MLNHLLHVLPFSVGTLRLLIVDDQQVNIRVLHEIFKQDYEVLMAMSGEQAISICRGQQPDLILLDVVMPGMSGHEVCKVLKADPATRNIPIIFVISHSEPAEEALGFDLGAVDFITKPINPVTVKARVRTHLELKLQQDLLRSIALIDGLTGVANRSKFDDDLALTWRRCLRENTAMSLLILDVDYFKLFNDAYGHPAGDNCLRQVAQAMKKQLRRPSDLVARIGGEEFACILPFTDQEGAINRAEAMLDAVRELGIMHRDSAISDTVTVSIGTATLVPNEALSAEHLLNSADQALYKAKRQGRDQLVSVML
ncbi:diguanylate cyclase domain-containing protein [Pokkaliibacter plantistimulans]|uniref:diguanylate cyclase domain-containing protein n=1 Tax=Pokkaliibacter plantistimulans TaxID=1635171 RepID=UPI001A9C6C8F|nr:diguanylate cyclase [Pokkaliibacter plantistimulans]